MTCATCLDMLTKEMHITTSLNVRMRYASIMQTMLNTWKYYSLALYRQLYPGQWKIRLDHPIMCQN